MSYTWQEAHYHRARLMRLDAKELLPRLQKACRENDLAQVDLRDCRVLLEVLIDWLGMKGER